MLLGKACGEELLRAVNHFPMVESGNSCGLEFELKNLQWECSAIQVSLSGNTNRNTPHHKDFVY